MTNIVLFKPRRELSAEKNLAAFVSFCRDELTIFGTDLDFENMSWDITKYVNLKGKDQCRSCSFQLLGNC